MREPTASQLAVTSKTLFELEKLETREDRVMMLYIVVYTSCRVGMNYGANIGFVLGLVAGIACGWVMK